MIRTVIVVAFVAAAVLVAAPASSPVQVSYVYSGSMVPTIGVGDGYLLVPAGHVHTGDIVTFWSRTRGTYTTHRIVGRTVDGFLTKGDHNPTTDQAAGYPAIPRSAVVGRVFTWRGSPVTVPHLGDAVRFVHRHVAVVAGLLGLTALLGRSDPRPGRPETARDVVRPLLAVAVVATAAVVAFGGATHAETMVAVAHATGPGTIHTLVVGSSAPANFTVAVPSRPWTERVVHATGLHGVSVARNATAMRVSGTVRAPATPGPVPISVTARSYPAVLPRRALVRLDALDPLLAAGVCAGLVFAPVVALVALLVDGRERLRPGRSRWWRLLTGGLE